MPMLPISSGYRPVFDDPSPLAEGLANFGNAIVNGQREAAQIGYQRQQVQDQRDFERQQIGEQRSWLAGQEAAGAGAYTGTDPNLAGVSKMRGAANAASIRAQQLQSVRDTGEIPPGLENDPQAMAAKDEFHMNAEARRGTMQAQAEERAAVAEMRAEQAAALRGGRTVTGKDQVVPKNGPGPGGATSIDKDQRAALDQMLANHAVAQGFAHWGEDGKIIIDDHASFGAAQDKIYKANGFSLPDDLPMRKPTPAAAPESTSHWYSPWSWGSDAAPTPAPSLGQQIVSPNSITAPATGPIGPIGSIIAGAQAPQDASSGGDSDDDLMHAIGSANMHSPGAGMQAFQALPPATQARLRARAAQAVGGSPGGQGEGIAAAQAAAQGAPVAQPVAPAKDNTITPQVLNQYAAKHRMTPQAAAAYLRSQGFAPAGN